MRPRLFLFTVSVLLAPLLSGRAGGPALGRYEFTRPEMGTIFRIVLYAPDASAAARASEAAFARIEALDNIMSDYRAGSELMRLSERSGGPPVEVSEDLFRILEKVQELAARSDGAFDITVGPVVRLWREARRRRTLPDPEELKQAFALVGYKKLDLDAHARTVRLAKPKMLLDLGGIAKGYAADAALAVLKEQGISSALVAAGGDVAVSGPPPGRRGWRIGIASLEKNKPPARYIVLHDAAVSTSGDAEQFVEIAGKRYSHIVDPRTGMGLVGRSSVSIIAPDCTTSDSLATAVSVLGPARGLELVRSSERTAALIVQATEDGVRSYEWRFPATPASADETALDP